MTVGKLPTHTFSIKFTGKLKRKTLQSPVFYYTKINTNRKKMLLKGKKPKENIAKALTSFTYNSWPSGSMATGTSLGCCRGLHLVPEVRTPRSCFRSCRLLRLTLGKTLTFRLSLNIHFRYRLKFTLRHHVLTNLFTFVLRIGNCWIFILETIIAPCYVRHILIKETVDQNKSW